MKKSELRQIIKEELQRLEEASTNYKLDDELKFSLSTLKKIYQSGYGARVIGVGGGYSDSLEFGRDMEDSNYVKKVLEKNKLDIVLQNAKRELKYAIDPSDYRKGRRLFIRITDLP